MISLWFLHPGFDLRRAQFYFTKNERSLKCACHSVDWMVTEWWLICDWNPSFPSPFSRHSATIQSTERWDLILWGSSTSQWHWLYLVWKMNSSLFYTFLSNFLIKSFLFRRSNKSCCVLQGLSTDVRSKVLWAHDS